MGTLAWTAPLGVTLENSACSAVVQSGSHEHPKSHTLYVRSQVQVPGDNGVSRHMQSDNSNEGPDRCRSAHSGRVHAGSRSLTNRSGTWCSLPATQRQAHTVKGAMPTTPPSFRSRLGASIRAAPARSHLMRSVCPLTDVLSGGPPPDESQHTSFCYAARVTVRMGLESLTYGNGPAGRRHAFIISRSSLLMPVF